MGAVIVAAVWAGAINTLVGSGTLVTFPVLLALGVPPVTANISNSIGLVAGGDQQPGLAPVDPVHQVSGRKLRGGRDDHRAQPDRAQCQLPQRHAVAQHHQQPITPSQPE